ncbi:hypothetical protein JAAARDRAFT_37269 [Jaapia argillacea MUCL 33604]|uniref:R3H domain-containing protein n=1 Tax=Jaapia argillacea MUCL 33604 TaxID=933084 RepID=A0A067PPW2_9AGAM|nr:hypothetical protein JAAARDRAFT_37269 [Jaapia argillacea MUCL 33604]
MADTIALDSTTTKPSLEDTGPIPMSFPAILRNPGLSSKFAHLRSEVPRAQGTGESSATKKKTRDDKEGKRWIRRKENARFTDNPHIVLATKKDFSLTVPTPRSTFPEPLPHYLSRNTKLGNVATPTTDPISANAGRFSLSIKGMRRDLKKSGPRGEYLVSVIEAEMVNWLSEGGVLLSPDANITDRTGATEDSTTLVGGLDTIKEVSRTPLQLVWEISDDPFARYVVHCCARYHEVVSFSKDTTGQRLTYLLRPNVTRPDRLAQTSLDTPPVTDLSELSAHELTSNDFSSSDVEDSILGSDIDEREETSRPEGLEAIRETSTPSSPALLPHVPPPSGADSAIPEDEWSVIGDSDREQYVAEGDGEDESGSEVELSQSFSSFTLQDHLVPMQVQTPTKAGQAPSNPHPSPVNDSDRTPLAPSNLSPYSGTHRSFRTRTSVWDHPQRPRSGSSPSRSPSRRLPRRVVSRVEPIVKVTPRTKGDMGGRSLYAYAFL